MDTSFSELKEPDFFSKPNNNKSMGKDLDPLEDLNK